MGLKILHNGTITEYAGAEYDPGSYGSARMNIKVSNGSTHKYGLTSDMTASQYCKMSFKVNGSTVRIGRRETRTSESSYVSEEPRYTYTYQTVEQYTTGGYRYTYSGSREIVEYYYGVTGTTSYSTTRTTQSDSRYTAHYSGPVSTARSHSTIYSFTVNSTNGARTAGGGLNTTGWTLLANSTSASPRNATSSSVSSGSSLVGTVAGSFTGNRTSADRYRRWTYTTSTSSAIDRAVTSNRTYSVNTTGTLSGTYTLNAFTNTAQNLNPIGVYPAWANYTKNGNYYYETSYYTSYTQGDQATFSRSIRASLAATSYGWTITSATSTTTVNAPMYVITAVYSSSYTTTNSYRYVTLQSNPYYSSSMYRVTLTRSDNYTTHNFNV